MKTALSSLTSERERLKQCLDHETCPPTSPQVVGLKNALATVRENNTHSHAATEMLSVSRNRLGRTVTLLSDVVSSHTTHQAWHIDEPLGGITSCWCDVCPPEPCSTVMFPVAAASHSEAFSIFCLLVSHVQCHADFLCHVRTSVLSTPTHFFDFKHPAGS